MDHENVKEKRGAVRDDTDIPNGKESRQSADTRLMWDPIHTRSHGVSLKQASPEQSTTTLA